MREGEEKIDKGIRSIRSDIFPFYMQVAIRVQTTQSNSSLKTTQSNSSRMGTILIRFGRLPQTLNQLHVGSNNGSLIS